PNGYRLLGDLSGEVGRQASPHASTAKPRCGRHRRRPCLSRRPLRRSFRCRSEGTRSTRGQVSQRRIRRDSFWTRTLGRSRRAGATIQAGFRSLVALNGTWARRRLPADSLVLVAQAVPGGAWFGPLTWPWSTAAVLQRRWPI